EGRDGRITAGKDVSLTAKNSAQITSTAIMLSVAASGGKNSVAASLGAAVSENFIGYHLDGSSAPAQVRAYLDNTSVSPGGDLKLDAETTGMQINATVVAGVAAVTVGTSNAFGIGGARGGSAHRTTPRVRAPLLRRPPSSAARVSLSASDTSTITATAAAVSLAASFGNNGFAVSIGLGLATNNIDNTVQAYIANVSQGVTTTSGGISVKSTENATINAVSAAAALAAAGALGIGVAVSGAGAEATNTILGKDNAYVSASNIKSAGSVTLDAEDTSQINATIVAAAVSLGIGLGDGGA